MIQEIRDHLRDLEKREKIKILLAVESGSRAWGCPSPDSDYDIRVVFIRRTQNYLSIDGTKDSLDYFHGDLLDINGWDIRKALKLIRKSNVTPFEWVQSPIVYHEENGMIDEIMRLANIFFDPRHALNHYIGLAKNSYLSNELPESIKLKKLFYVLRPLMAAKWIVKNESIPPMDIPSLLPIVKNKKALDKIMALLEIKLTANEDYVHPLGIMIRNYIDDQFMKLGNSDMAKRESLPSNIILNTAFRKLLNTYG